MTGKLLTDEEYLAMLSLRTVSELAKKLTEHEQYKQILSGEQDIHRGYAERRIVLSLHEEFARIYSFVTDPVLRNYMDAFFLKNQIDFIKKIMSSIVDERDIKYSVSEVNHYLGRYQNFDLTPLINAKTLADAIEALNGTSVYSQLKTKDGSKAKLFDLEMRLDVFYYLHLHKLQNKYLSGTNKKIAKEINGTEIDMTNISWIYRIKKYYKIQETAIYAYIIPINYRLKKQQVIRMVEAKSMAELTEEIIKSPYGDYFKDIESFDRNFYIIKNATLSKMRALYPHSIANILAYIYFKESEIRNITSLIEGIRYGLKQDEIMKYILLPSVREVI